MINLKQFKINVQYLLWEGRLLLRNKVVAIRGSTHVLICNVENLFIRFINNTIQFPPNTPLVNFDMILPVAGDSSGGYLTAAVSLRLRDEKWSPQPKLQVGHQLRHLPVCSRAFTATSNGLFCDVLLVISNNLRGSLFT